MKPLLVFAVVLLPVVFQEALAASIGSQNKIRLSNGFAQNEGAVEILVRDDHSGKRLGLAWGVVCVPASPSTNIGQVACRQLGYDTFASYLDSSTFGVSKQSVKRVAMKVTECRGSELRLTDCTSSETFPETCHHSERLLAVLCARSGSVRFEQLNNSSHSGVVEAYVNNTWRDVCTERSTTRHRLCRQLGFSTVAKTTSVERNKQPFYFPHWQEGDEMCVDTHYSTEGCVSYSGNGVEGVVECGNSDLSVKCVGPIGKVERPRVHLTTDTTAHIRWTVPDSRNLEIGHFTVAYWPTTRNRNHHHHVQFQRVLFNGGNLERQVFVIRNLEPNTEYYVEVGVTDSMEIHVGEFSEQVMFKTKIARPLQPSGLEFESSNGKDAILKHKPLLLSNGSQLEVKYWIKGSEDSCVSFQSGPYTSRFKLRGLQANVTYNARMRAIQDIDGVDVYSDFSNDTVRFALGQNGETIEQPDAPSHVTAERRSVSSILLSWSHPDPTLQFGWQCLVMDPSTEWAAEGSLNGTDSSGSNSMSTLISVPNLELTCKVYVKDNFGDKIFSDSVTVEPLAPPETPVLSVEVIGNRVLLSFSARRRRQIVTRPSTPIGGMSSTAPTTDITILGVQCTLDPTMESRSYYWEDPVGSNLELGDLPHNIKGNCTARLFTSRGTSEPSVFQFSTPVTKISQPPVLLSPEVSGADGIKLSWVIPMGHQPFGYVTKSIVRLWNTRPPNSNHSYYRQELIDSGNHFEIDSLPVREEVFYSVALKNDVGIGPFSAPQMTILPHTVITTEPSVVISIPREITTSSVRLMVQWEVVKGAEGYVVTATALNALDDSVTAVGIVLASELTGPSSSYRGETVLSFNISCVSHFTYKVAAFNSDSKGRFSPVGTHRLTNTLCDAVADPSVGSEDMQLYLYILIGLVVVVVILLLAASLVIVCLLYHYCMTSKVRKEEVADGNSNFDRRGSQTTIRSSERYIGVKSRRLLSEPKPEFYKSEDELTKRPLPIPTESDLEDEEEEEEMKIESLRKSMSPPPVPPTMMQLNAGYSTIPGSVQEEIVNSVRHSSNNLLLSSSVSQSLLEQGYEFVQSTSASMLGSQARMTSPTDPTYNVPRSSRHGSRTPTEYEVPISSRPNTPMGTPGRGHTKLNPGLKSVSAPHALTYDVPPSRNRVLVTGGTYDVPRSPSPMGMYDTPRKALSRGDTPNSITTPPPQSPFAPDTYDIPRRSSGGFGPPVIVTTPPPEDTRPGVPYIKTPDSLYDVPSSHSAVNEYGYDVLPARSPMMQRRDLSDTHSSSSPLTSAPSLPPRTEEGNELYENIAPSEISDIVSSPPPAMNGDMYDTPRNVLASEEDPVISSGGATKNSSIQDDLYDTPRKVANPSSITSDDDNEVFEVDDTALEWKTGVSWEIADDLEDDNQSTNSGRSKTEATLSLERSPSKPKSENPYSRVKRMMGENGLEAKMTVVDDAPQLTDKETSGSPQKE